MEPQHLARMKERLQPRVDELDLRRIDIASFRKYLADFRGRRVYLFPCTLGPEIFGIWAAADTFDCIFYEQNTTPYHQRHLVLHEGSHMLLGHRGPPLPDVLCLVAPYLDPKLIRSLMCSSVFNEAEEADADMLATLIEQHADQASPPPIPNVSPWTTHDITEFFLRDR